MVGSNLGGNLQSLKSDSTAKPPGLCCTILLAAGVNVTRGDVKPGVTKTVFEIYPH